LCGQRPFHEKTEKDSHMTKELNCCGLAYPEPVIRCRRMLEEEKPASLRVVVVNTAVPESLDRCLFRFHFCW